MSKSPWYEGAHAFHDLQSAGTACAERMRQKQSMLWLRSCQVTQGLESKIEAVVFILRTVGKLEGFLSTGDVHCEKTSLLATWSVN